MSEQSCDDTSTPASNYERQATPNTKFIDYDLTLSVFAVLIGLGLFYKLVFCSTNWHFGLVGIGLLGPENTAKSNRFDYPRDIGWIGALSYKLVFQCIHRYTIDQVVLS